MATYRNTAAVAMVMVVGRRCRLSIFLCVRAGTRVGVLVLAGEWYK